MNELQISGIDLKAIKENPSNYPEEVVAAALTLCKKYMADLYETKVRLEGNIINRMTEDGATKLIYKDVSGDDKTITLSAPKMECKEKQADIAYKAAGFDPIEIGSFEFKPSWTKAKQAEKFGGAKKEIINKLFQAGKRGITIK